MFLPGQSIISVPCLVFDEGLSLVFGTSVFVDTYLSSEGWKYVLHIVQVEQSACVEFRGESQTTPRIQPTLSICNAMPDPELVFFLEVSPNEPPLEAVIPHQMVLGLINLGPELEEEDEPPIEDDESLWGFVDL